MKGEAKTEAKARWRKKKKSQNKSTEEDDKEPQICWICHGDEDTETEGNLIIPCKCKGSMEVVHEYCLIKWIEAKVLDGSNDISESRCPHCLCKYNIVMDLPEDEPPATLSRAWSLINGLETEEDRLAAKAEYVQLTLIIVPLFFCLCMEFMTLYCYWVDDTPTEPLRWSDTQGGSLSLGAATIAGYDFLYRIPVINFVLAFFGYYPPPQKGDIPHPAGITLKWSHAFVEMQKYSLWAAMPSTFMVCQMFFDAAGILFSIVSEECAKYGDALDGFFETHEKLLMDFIFRMVVPRGIRFVRMCVVNLILADFLASDGLFSTICYKLLSSYVLVVVIVIADVSYLHACIEDFIYTIEDQCLNYGIVGKVRSVGSVRSRKR